MTVPHYSYDDVLKATRLPDLIREMDEHLATQAGGDTVVPPRTVLVEAEPHSIFLSMPALCRSLGLYIDKVGTFFAREPGSAIPSIHAMVMAYSSRTGQPLGILNGQAVTAVKCAAVTAVVTDCCAHPQAETLAVIGAGIQARQQIDGVFAVRPIRRVRLVNRSRPRLDEFAAYIRHAAPEVEIIIAGSVEEAVEGAEIVATATSCDTPLATFDNLSPIAHVNVMGGHTDTSREVPLGLLRRAILVVEDVATAVTEAGEVHRAALPISALRRTGTDRLQNGLTVFSSTGHALLDAITVAHVLKLAVHQSPPSFRVTG